MMTRKDLATEFRAAERAGNRAEMDRLDREHSRLHRQDRKPAKGEPRKAPSLLTWAHSPHRRSWKIAICVEGGRWSRKTLELARNRYRIDSPRNGLIS